MSLYGYYTPPPPQPPPAQPQKEPPQIAQEEKKKEPLADPRTFTGVVIDARKVEGNASLFPKIQDEKKKEFYTVGQVNKEDLQKRGMASYAVVSRDAVISKLFPKARVIQVRYMPEGSSTAAKRREGDKPLVLSSVGLDGALKTNLVLDEENAAKLQQMATQTNVLKECRVVIVFSSL
jgi:hypothetical protein